jgi:hypothetical protein
VFKHEVCKCEQAPLPNVIYPAIPTCFGLLHEEYELRPHSSPILAKLLLQWWGWKMYLYLGGVKLLCRILVADQPSWTCRYQASRAAERASTMVSADMWSLHDVYCVAILVLPGTCSYWSHSRRADFLISITPYSVTVSPHALGWPGLTVYPPRYSS